MVVWTVIWEVSDSALLEGDSTTLPGEGDSAHVFSLGGIGGGELCSLGSAGEDNADGVDIIDLQASRTIAGDLIILECLVIDS